MAITFGHILINIIYSSFLLVLAMRADRRPAGVMTVPVFSSMGVPRVLGFVGVF
jgi:hypothetical protein